MIREQILKGKPSILKQGEKEFLIEFPNPFIRQGDGYEDKED